MPTWQYVTSDHREAGVVTASNFYEAQRIISKKLGGLENVKIEKVNNIYIKRKENENV